MRHLIGIALAIVMAAALFFAGAWGYLRLLRAPELAIPLSRLPADGGALMSEQTVLAALIAVAGTGVLAGLLVTVPRISPLAPGLPGLLLLGLTALYLASVRRAIALIPLKSHTFGMGFEAMLLHGILLAVGLVMVTPLFVPSRWRRYPSTDQHDAGEFIPGLAEDTEPPALAEPADLATQAHVPARASGPPSLHHRDTGAPRVS